MVSQDGVHVALLLVGISSNCSLSFFAPRVYGVRPVKPVVNE